MSGHFSPSLWPNLVSSYAYAGTASSATLGIDLALRTDAYDPPPGAARTGTRRPTARLPQWQQNIENDLAIYARACSQLEQNCDGLNMPGPSGNAVDILLTNTLFGPAPVPLPPAEAAKVRAYVADCVAYLQQRKDGETPASAPACHLDVPVAVNGAVDDDIVPLQVSLTLARRAVPADPALAAEADGLTATAEVAARTDTTDGVALDGFAAAFEAIFTTADWELRVGTGNGEPSQPRGAASRSVWAVRLAKGASGKGLGFELGTGMSYYAAKPLANALRSGTVDVVAYATGSGLAPKGTPTTFDGVDLNVWAQAALGAIDTFLTPSFSSPALAVDAMGPDPDTQGVVAKVLRHKETLAGAIGDTVAPILVTSKTDADSLGAADEKLRQELLRELSAAYSVSAIAVCDVTGARYDGVLPAGVKPPRFYGQPVRAAGGRLHAGAPGLGTNYALGSTRIPLTTKADGTTRMAFAFRSKNVTDATEVTLPLRYAGSYLEYDITSVPGIAGYEQSSRITFVTGPVARDLAGGEDLRIPIPLRVLPAPPTLTVQTAQPWQQTAGDSGAPAAGVPTPGDLARWNYGFGYIGSRFAQDAARGTADFDVIPPRSQPPAPALLATTPDDSMFAALAQFVSVSAQIAADFQTALRGIGGDTDPASTQVGVARAAMNAFETIIGGFAAAYAAWAAQQSSARFAQGSDLLPAVQFVFDLRLTTYTDRDTGQSTDQAQIDVVLSLARAGGDGAAQTVGRTGDPRPDDRTARGPAARRRARVVPLRAQGPGAAARRLRRVRRGAAGADAHGELPPAGPLRVSERAERRADRAQRVPRARRGDDRGVPLQHAAGAVHPAHRAAAALSRVPADPGRARAAGQSADRVLRPAPGERGQAGRAGRLAELVLVRAGGRHAAPVRPDRAAAAGTGGRDGPRVRRPARHDDRALAHGRRAAGTGRGRLRLRALGVLDGLGLRAAPALADRQPLHRRLGRVPARARPLTSAAGRRPGE